MTTDVLATAKQNITAKRFDEALSVLLPALEAEPANVEVLYLAAVSRRYLGDNERALAMLDQLTDLQPEHGRAYQEVGHNHRDLQRYDDALQAYRSATRFNPALAASWRSQLAILERQGREPEASQVHVQLGWLQSLPKPLVAVLDLTAQGQLLKAETLCRKFLKAVPDQVDGIRMLADIGQRLGVLDDAEFLLESATKLEPENISVRIDYVQVLRKRQKFSSALEQARQLVSRSPDNPQFLSLYAIESMQTGDYDEALRTFDEVLEKVPGDPGTLTSKGHALKTRGDYNAAVESYRAAIRSAPEHGEAYHALANLKVYTFSEEEIADMEMAVQSGKTSFMDRVYLNFALGKAYEGDGDHENSFGFYERGNRLKKSQSRYDADQMTADLEAPAAVCTAEFFAERADHGADSPDPIFIVGLPRAGSTLLEQILSSHSQVDGTLELPNILALSQKLRRDGRAADASPYPNNLAELTPEQCREFGETYIRDTRIHRQDAPFFIDKMPNNFRHIGLIKLILPNAKIIDARRHPMACGFSGFKQLFAEGQEFTYSLEDVGQYYRDYVRLMDHWDLALPGHVLRVSHEAVVDDLERQVRRLLDFCGLPFEPACLEFYRTERNIRTPSSEQVRQPINRSGLDIWRHYEPWLEPLKHALGPALRRTYAIDDRGSKISS